MIAYDRPAPPKQRDDMLEHRLGFRCGEVPGRRAADADPRDTRRSLVRIAKIDAGNSSNEKCAIGHASRHHTDRIQRFGHHPHTTAMDEVIAWLVSDHAAIRGGTDDTATGLRRKSERKE